MQVRSSSFQIEPANIGRHSSDFIVQSRSQTAELARPLVTNKTFKGVKWGWTAGTGLLKGEGGDISLDYRNVWRKISEDSSITMRYWQDLYNEVIAKKFIHFFHQGKKYSVLSVLNVNGESIYMTLGVEFSK